MRYVVVLDMPKTIIHIGMPRTASTFFQREVFPFIQDFTCIGPEVTQHSPNFQRLLYQDDTLWQPDIFRQLLPNTPNENLLISNELFSGQGLTLSATNRTRTARRLKEQWPDAEIVLLVRNQVDLLQSLYAIGVYGGHHMSPEEFLYTPDSTTVRDKDHYPTFVLGESMEPYLYTPLVELYAALFQKVHVFLFEDFEAIPKEFMVNFSQRFGLSMEKKLDYGRKQNRSLSARQLYYIKILNQWKPLLQSGRLGRGLFRMKLRFIERNLGGGKAFAFSDELRQELNLYYFQDNAKLKKMRPELTAMGHFDAHYLRT